MRKKVPVKVPVKDPVKDPVKQDPEGPLSEIANFAAKVFAERESWGKQSLSRAPVIAYVTEEVARQGHTLTLLDGIERVGWMLNGWCYAIRASKIHGAMPSAGDALIIGNLIEPEKNARGARNCRITVGGRPAGAEPENIVADLTLLFERQDEFTPLEFYKKFEEIHPFVDGNGRTGKVLYNMINGTLFNPIFPPADLFGYPISNP